MCRQPPTVSLDSWLAEEYKQVYLQQSALPGRS
jgi:hypothetical protein